MKIIISAVLALFASQFVSAEQTVRVVKVSRGGVEANAAPAAPAPAAAARSAAKRKGHSSRNTKSRKTGEGDKTADRTSAAEKAASATVDSGEIRLDGGSTAAGGAGGVGLGAKDAPPPPNPDGEESSGGAGANSGPIEQNVGEKGSNIKKVEPRHNPTN